MFIYLWVEKLFALIVQIYMYNTDVSHGVFLVTVSANLQSLKEEYKFCLRGFFTT